MTRFKTGPSNAAFFFREAYVRLIFDVAFLSANNAAKHEVNLTTIQARNRDDFLAM